MSKKNGIQLCGKLDLCLPSRVTNLENTEKKERAFYRVILRGSLIFYFILTLFRKDGSFGACSPMCVFVWGGGGCCKKHPLLPKIFHTYHTMTKLGTVIPYLKKTQKYMHHVTHPLSSADISIFHQKSANFALSKNTDIDCIFVHNLYFFFYFFWVIKDIFNKHGYNFDDANKIDYSRLS